MLKLTIDPISFPVKPNRYEFSLMSNRLCSDNTVECEDDSYIDLIANQGHAFAPVFNGSRKNENFVSTNLIALDFDSTINYTEFKEMIGKTGITPLFTYKTYSCSTTSIDRFRAVFHSSVELNAVETKYLCKHLYEAYGKLSDACVLKLAQPYLGNMNGLIEKFEICSPIDKMLCNINTDIINVSYKNSSSSTDIDTLSLLGENSEVQKDIQLVGDTNYNYFNSCTIWVDLKDKNYTSYLERFQILSNLAYVKGGISKITNLFPLGKEEKAIKDARYYKSHYSQPIACNKCPRYEECNVKPYNLLKLLTKETYIPEIKETISLEQGSLLLSEMIKNAYTSDKLSIIKAQTGLGKTEELVKNVLPGAIYCFPTHALKNEFVYRVAEANPETLMLDTLPLPIENMEEGENISVLYMKKEYKLAHAKIMAEIDKEGVLEFVNAKERAKRLNTNDILATTHKLLPSMLKLYPDRKIIVDEDPDNIIWTLDSISANLAGIDTEFLEPNKVYKIETPIEYSKVGLVRDFQNSKYYEVSNNKRGISYMKQINYSLNNCIILSATIDKNKYEIAFEDIFYQEVPYIKIKGTLNQWDNATYSKSYMKLNQKAIEDIKQKHKDTQIITHYDEELKGTENYIHMRNSEGKDFLKGKNITIIGTSFPLPTKMRLLAACISGEIQEDDCMRVRKVVMEDGRIFDFFTYTNETLRKIHLGEIEAILLQCVGRARLLRTDAIVNVYSDFILPEAHLQK